MIKQKKITIKETALKHFLEYCAREGKSPVKVFSFISWIVEYNENLSCWKKGGPPSKPKEML